MENGQKKNAQVVAKLTKTGGLVEYSIPAKENIEIHSLMQRGFVITSGSVIQLLNVTYSGLLVVVVLDNEGEEIAVDEIKIADWEEIQLIENVRSIEEIIVYEYSFKIVK